MPRVSDEHRAARRRQIADAAARCFEHNGFHATSMQDVIREAGLSAGAVYRYFPSKEALVREIATETIAHITAEIDEALQTDPLPPLDQVLDTMIRAAEPYEQTRLRIAIQTWGEALRNPDLAELVSGIYATVQSRMVEIARRAREGGQLPPDSDDEAVGVTLFGLMPGYILQRVLLGTVDRETYIAGLGTLLRARTPEPPST